MTLPLRDIEAAHEHCFGNQVELQASEIACCIACAQTFDVKRVTEWIGQLGWDEPTGFCPVCGFDALIGDASGLPVNDPSFVTSMNSKYFGVPHGMKSDWDALKC